ncbi:MAG: hypothetical protein AAB036_10670 [Elusimicrobiota bacterium]
MRIVLTALIMWTCSTAMGEQVFEPATKISYSLHPTVVANSVTASQAHYKYSYELNSGLSSIQNIWRFDIRITSNSVFGMDAPLGWSVGVSAIGTIAWGGIEMERQIPPGKRLSGFSFISPNLPGIVEVFAQGYVPLPKAVQFVDETTPAPPDREQDSVRAMTVGPSTLTFTTPAEVVVRLIGLKHQSASLGWLGDAKFVLKLDKRLDQAKAALARDKKKLARVRLSQFAHELAKAHDENKTERGKNKNDPKDKTFVSDEAFQLLKINADFIIAKLPSKGKDKAEDDECRRAEAEKDD